MHMKIQLLVMPVMQLWNWGFSQRKNGMAAGASWASPLYVQKASRSFPLHSVVPTPGRGQNAKVNSSIIPKPINYKPNQSINQSNRHFKAQYILNQTSSPSYPTIYLNIHIYKSSPLLSYLYISINQNTSINHLKTIAKWSLTHRGNFIRLPASILHPFESPKLPSRWA